MTDAKLTQEIRSGKRVCIATFATNGCQFFAYTKEGGGYDIVESTCKDGLRFFLVRDRRAKQELRWVVEKILAGGWKVVGNHYVWE